MSKRSKKKSSSVAAIPLWKIEHGDMRQQLRAELAIRSAGERLFDEVLLSRLQQGASFATALAEANATYPTEALIPDSDNLPDIEAHYRCLLGWGWR